MKTLKEGKLPETAVMYGACSHCGCQIECSRMECEMFNSRNETYWSVPCPTTGCCRMISVHETEPK